jgi:hypothetical protein
MRSRHGGSDGYAVKIRSRPQAEKHILTPEASWHPAGANLWIVNWTPKNAKNAGQ